MLLTFCRHRIERQMMHVRKGWAKLKATSMHSDRLSDSMLAAIMSAATQLKSLVAEVMLAVSKGAAPRAYHMPLRELRHAALVLPPARESNYHGHHRRRHGDPGCLVGAEHANPALDAAAAWLRCRR